MGFPIDRKNERTLDPGFRGHVLTCDIDRTYLYTRFSTLKGLASIPIEFAVDKEAIEGMPDLLREARRGPGRTSRSTPLYFISASPSQLRPVIERKMLLDGVEFDGTTFKDWLGVLRSFRFSRLRDQVGFKLTALLSARAELPAGAEEILVGDDLEADPLIFALYADVLAGRLRGEPLRRTLRRHRVAEEDAAGILGLAEGLPTLEGVSRAFIRLERFATPGALLDFSPRVVACQGALQIAIGLLGEGCLSVEGVARVARGLLGRGVGPDLLSERLGDALGRGILEGDPVGELQAALAGLAVSARNVQPAAGAGDRIVPAAVPGASARRWTPERLL